MFYRQDNLVVTQAEHSRLSGELALLFGRFLRQPEAQIERLAGAIALHDWPHFGGLQADVIQIGKKTAEQQRELVDRLTGELPVDPFTELIIRLHWGRLSAEGDVEIRNAVNQDRVAELIALEGLSFGEVRRLDQWTEFCDSLAFYISRGGGSATENVLPNLAGEQVWEFDWSMSSDSVTLRPGRCDGAALESLEFSVSLLAYQADGYPQKLSPVMKVICCKSGA